MSEDPQPSAEKDAGRVLRHKPEFTTDPADTYDVPPLPDAESAAGLQRRLYEVERDAGWGETTFGEEIAHLHEEVSEAFREYRAGRRGHAVIGGKPAGVAAELADVVIGCFYIAEQQGFNLLAAVDEKSAYNTTRSYQREGRQLRAPATRVLPPGGGAS